MSLYLGNTLISGVSIPTAATHIFDFKWADHLLSNQDWLRADTFSWQDGTTYSNAYNHLVEDLSGITSETETIGSYTVTFYRATDGHKICLADQETTVLNIYNETGVAWYYILDTANTRFKLPRTKFGFEGLRTNVGDLIEAGLPNISGTIDGVRGDFISSTGAFTLTTADKDHGSTGAANGYQDISFSASDSNSIYGNSNIVQENATQMYLYFYVGEFAQSAMEQTAGLNSELFNGKADVDLTNINNTAKISISHYGKPAAIQPATFTLGASGASYVAPADGLFCWAVTASGLSSYNLVNGSAYNIQSGGVANGNGYIINLIVPCKKGDYIYAYYQLAPSSYSLQFYYDVGSESEAQ